MEGEPRPRAFERIQSFIDRVARPEAPYRPSAQRDVGKSATRAAEVSLVISGLTIERPDAAQLSKTMSVPIE